MRVIRIDTLSLIRVLVSRDDWLKPNNRSSGQKAKGTIGNEIYRKNQDLFDPYCFGSATSLATHGKGDEYSCLNVAVPYRYYIRHNWTTRRAC